MRPDACGNRPHSAVDDATMLLPSVGRDSDATQILSRFGVEHGHFGDLRHPVFMRPAVPPAQPAQPHADWDRPEMPDCKKRSMAIALIFGAGVVVGAVIATIRWWFW